MVAGHSRTSADCNDYCELLEYFHLTHVWCFVRCVGRRVLMISGAVTGIVVIWPIFLLVQQQNFWMLIAMVLATPIVQAMMGGVFNT